MLRVFYPVGTTAANWPEFLKLTKDATGRHINASLDQANISLQSHLAFASAISNLEKTKSFADSLKDYSIFRHVHTSFFFIMDHDLVCAMACIGPVKVTFYPHEDQDDIGIVSGTLLEWIQHIKMLLKTEQPTLKLFGQGLYKVFDTMGVSRAFPDEIKKHSEG